MKDLKNETQEGNHHCPTVAALLAALTTQQRQDLELYARKELDRQSNTPWRKRYLSLYDAQELVARVIFKVLIGEGNPREGRRLAPRNRVNPTALLNCLRGIVRSDIANLLRKAEAKYPQVRIQVAELMVAEDHQMTIARRDLHEVVLDRLRDRTADSPALQELILRLEEDFLVHERLADSEPDRKLVARLRRLLRQILQDLSRDELGIKHPTGQELLF